MTSEPLGADAGPPPDDLSPPPPPTARRSGLPPWVPMFLLAVTPAIIVGVVVYVLFAGKGGSSAAGAIDGFIHLGQSSSTVLSYDAKTPPGFPSDFPIYSGAKIVASFAIGSTQGTSYLVVLSSPDSPQKIYEYYVEKLDEDPWQVEVGRSSTDFTAVGFSRPSDANIQGDISLYQSDLDGHTSMYVTMQDAGNTSVVSAKPFPMEDSRALPKDFPNDVSIYDGRSKSTVIDTYFERSPGFNTYYITFLTSENPDTVVDAYRSQFQNKGWTVADSTTGADPSAPPPSGSLLQDPSIDFSDGQTRTISGTVTAGAFPPDSKLTKVDLIVQVSTSRRQGN